MLIISTALFMQLHCYDSWWRMQSWAFLKYPSAQYVLDGDGFEYNCWLGESGHLLESLTYVVLRGAD